MATELPTPGVTPRRVWAEMINEGILSREEDARNADNLTSGTVNDALIPSTIARESEIAGAVTTQVGSSKGIDWRRVGPVTTDITSCTQTNTPDGSLNQQYLLGNNAVVTSAYPVDPGVGTPKVSTQANGYWEMEYPVLGGRVFSMVTDAPKLAFRFAYASALYAYQVFIDGAPVTLNPVVGNGQQYLTIVFPSAARARLVEVMTRASPGSVYVAKPYRVWKPAPKPAPKILVMGDSYAMSTVYDAAGVATAGEFGIYHRMRADLGVVNMGVDGVGGTGYIKQNAGGLGGPNNNYADRLSSALALEPDVLVIHGGGANDLLDGQTNAAIIAAATAVFEDARAALPNAKLVFVEGFSPPVFTPGTYNPNYIAIRAGVQANLMDTGVYYIDVATTDPWLSGTGYFGATNGTGNSDIYIGPDGVHLMAAGCDYLRSRMADRLRVVLADNGTLLNTLI